MSESTKFPDHDPRDIRDNAHDDAVSPPSPGPPAAQEPPDLTARIIAFVEKEPGDVVRCTRVGTDTYRCNWWSPYEVVGSDDPAVPGGLFATHRVRKSQFMAVTPVLRGLDIRIRPDAASGRRALTVGG